MSSSEFEAIISVLSETVSFLFNLTVDALCTCLLLLSCILPYRVSLILKIFSDREGIAAINATNNNKHLFYRGVCFMTFAFTIMDVFLFISLILIFITPRRWMQVYYAFKCYYNEPYNVNHRRIENLMETELILRTMIFNTFCNSLSDILALFAYFVLLLSPLGRQFVYYYYMKAEKEFIRIHRQNNNTMTTIFKESFANYMEDKNNENSVIFKCGFSALYDLIVFFIAFPFIIIVPSVWYGTIQGIL